MRRKCCRYLFYVTDINTNFFFIKLPVILLLEDPSSNILINSTVQMQKIQLSEIVYSYHGWVSVTIPMSERILLVAFFTYICRLWSECPVRFLIASSDKVDQKVHRGSAKTQKLSRIFFFCCYVHLTTGDALYLNQQ